MGISTKKIRMFGLFFTILFVTANYQPLVYSYPFHALNGRARVLNTITVPPVIGDLTWDGEYLWAVSRSPPRILKIDVNSGDIIANLSTPCGFPYGLAWDGSAMWISDYASSQLYRYDIDTETTLAQINGSKYGEEEILERQLWYSQLAGLCWNGTHLWLVATLLGDVFLINGSDGAMIKYFDTPGIFPRGVDYHNGYLWNSDYANGRISRISPKGGPTQYHFEGPGEFPEGIAWASDSVWIADNTEKSIVKVDPYDTMGWGEVETPIYFGLPLWLWFIILFFSLPLVLSTIITWRKKAGYYPHTFTKEK